MFTGIITDMGEVVDVEGSETLRRLRIACAYDPATIDIGASIACAGTCLTVVHKGETSQGGMKTGGWFEVEAAAETLRLTNVGQWKPGTRINLERALKIGDELGGHIVTGHVDGLALIVAREEVTPPKGKSSEVDTGSREDFPTKEIDSSENWGATVRFSLQAPKPLHRFIAQKGSVTLDGVSLTVNTIEDDVFSVLLIPHTLKETTFGKRKAGERVHLEVDLMARYAARLAETG